MRLRTAKVHVRKGEDPLAVSDAVRNYLPRNYTVGVERSEVVIRGYDDHGWTLDGYVIPRLLSGLYAARETVEDE